MFQEEVIRKAIDSIIKAIGENPEREGLKDTPARVAKMYADLFSGIGKDPVSVLTTSFEEKYDEIVTIRNISFSSICEHHFLPFFGSAYIGYIPNGKVVGASKLARVVDIISHRPQIQERLTKQLADTIYEAINPKGVGVLVEAEHMCMSIRGVKKPGMLVVTSSSRGEFSNKTNTSSDLPKILKGN